MMRRHIDIHTHGRRGERGFTLIELMITLVVIAILAAIAYPLYLHQVQESRRTEARTALTELAAREERYYATNNTYTGSASLLGYGNYNWPITVGSGYYQVTVSAQSGTTTTPPSYVITATPIGTQANDSTCQKFTLNSTGTQISYDGSNNVTTSTCW